MAIFQFNDYEIDTENYQLRQNGKTIELEPKVFDLLSYLVVNRQRLVSRDELFENIWPGQVVSDTSLSNQIKAARQAIGDNGQTQSSIKTQHGRGYQFIAITEEKEITDGAPDKQEDDTLDFPDKPSIAVLPFTNINGDPDQNYFSDGITEDIITELSRFNVLFVVARNSSFKFRGTAVDVREVSLSLGVRFILQGAVRIANNKVRISCELVEATRGNEVWAERYDRDLNDVFAVQDDITRSIVSTITGRITDFDFERIRDTPTSNLSAYESVLRGQQLIHSYTEEDYLQARQFFEQAISLDPEFARAHAWLAYVELLIWYWQFTTERRDSAILIGETALKLDDFESKGHLAVGACRLFRSDHEKAEYHLQRAAKLNPNDDLIMLENGRYLMYTNAPLEGAEVIRQAMRQNPYHPNWYWNVLARCFHTAKHFEEAISALERITTPQFWCHAYLAVCYTELDQTEKAREHFETVFSQKPDFTITGFTTVLPYRDETVLKEFIAGFQRAGFPS